jgi:hypothetical protein
LDIVLAEHHISYALIGGLAVVLHGYDRFTQDVDAVAWDADDALPALVESFKEHGFSLRSAEGEQFARRNRVLLLISPAGRGVDLSLGMLPFESDLIGRAVQQRIGPDGSYPVATIDDLIVMKLIAGRDRDLDDIRRLIELHPNIDGPRIQAIVTEFSQILENPGILENLNQLIP